MKFPIIDKREDKDILKEIKKIAKQYTPEWHYSEQDPDFGVVFSEIFAKMFAEVVDRYNTMPYNHYVEFLNMLGTKLLPAIPASGMITVKPADWAAKQQDFVNIEKDSAVFATADTIFGRAIYKILDNMMAIDEKIKAIFLTENNYDVISKVYDIEKNGEKIQHFRIFDATANENLQSHIIYFASNYLFFTKESSSFSFYFHDSLSAQNNANLPEIFSNPENATWQYYKNKTWQDISNVERIKNGVKLQFDSDTETYELTNEHEKTGSLLDFLNMPDNSGSRALVQAFKPGVNPNSRVIRCIVKKIPGNGLRMTDVRYSSEKKQILPEVITMLTEELTLTDFYPFGEKYNFNEACYICSDEAFSKKGAKIDVEIDMKFLRFELDKIPLPDLTQYHYIMSDLDFQKTEIDDIQIDKVTWEYWNGYGWSRLFEHHDNDNFFKPEEDSNKKVLSFICPEDAESQPVGSKNGYFIRAKITKIKNQLNYMGACITPFINSVRINYEYPEPRLCEQVKVHSNLRDYIVNLKEDGLKFILKTELYDHPCMYFCLEKPINVGPIRVFFDVQLNLRKKVPSLLWQYYAKDKNGKEDWQNIEAIDLTNNLLTSEVISFIGRNNHVSTTLFEKEGYFLRLVNLDKEYDVFGDVETYPQIKDICFNTARIIQKEEKRAMEYYVEPEEADKICPIPVNNLLDVEVYVNEFGCLSSKEKENLKQNEDTIIHYDERGNIKAVWFKWHMIENLLCAGPNDRVYEVDYSNNQVTFGNGRFGKIPSHQPATASIKISYSTCEGALGNVEEQKVQNFMSYVFGVDWVKNLKPIVGGVNIETVPEAFERIPTQIAQLGRVVSLDDFIDMIKHKERTVQKVKCIPHTDKFGNKATGIISMAILPKDYMQGNEKFLISKGRIEKLIREKAPLNIAERPEKLQIFEVQYVEIIANLSIIIDDYNYYQTVHQEIIKSLQNFLNPITGNVDSRGWEIGEIPRKEIIHNHIKKIPHIRWIKTIRLSAKMVTLKGKKDVDIASLEKQPFIVPIYGEPDIRLAID